MKIGKDDLPVSVDEVSLRRLRQRVLDDAMARATGDSSGRLFRLPDVALVALLLIVVGGVASWLTRRSSPSPRSAVGNVEKMPPPPSSPYIEAISDGRASFTRQTRAGVERIDLHEGTLRLKVRRRPGMARVTIAVPDGEIEDVGTVFKVTVKNGQTRAVAVEDGRVVLRLRGREAVTIEAPEEWTSDAPKDDEAPSGTLPRRDSRLDRPARRSEARARGTASEDAAFLNVLSLIRADKADEARAAARDYLSRFPNGFRRAEIGRIAR